MISAGIFILSLISLTIIFCIWKRKWWYDDYHVYEDKGYKIFSTFWACVIGVFFSIGGSVVLLKIDGKGSFKEWKYYCEIQSIKNDSEVNGSFFLGTGSVDEKEYYYYFYRTDGGFRRGSKLVSEVLITEDDSLKPQLQRKVEKVTSRTGLIKDYTQEVSAWRIIVPTKTVINKFKLY